MKKKFGISLGSAILLAAICVGLVFAFSYTTTDGSWGRLTQGGMTMALTVTAGQSQLWTPSRMSSA